MKRINGMVLAVAALALVPASGCIIIAGVDGWDCDSRVWVEGDEQRITLDARSLEGVKVKSHNGSVAFTGTPGASSEAYVVYRVRAGSRSQGDAHEALDAVEVFVEQDEDKIAHVGWRWRCPKRRHWSATVNFDIHAPEHCKVNIQTYNGGVTGTSLAGDARLETHNGSVQVQAARGRLVAKTHNGPITVFYSGADLHLETHNGGIKADLRDCGEVNGRMITHNGGVSVTVGDGASAMVRASTHNGGITCKVPLVESTIERRQLQGRIGGGAGSLKIITHNGSVRIDRREG